MIKQKFITFLRIIFGKRPQVINKTVNIVQLSSSDLLKGKTALITGGSSGIGLEIAKAVLRAGGSVIITGRNEDKLKNNKIELEKIKTEKALVLTEIIDIKKIETLSKSFESIIEKLGGNQIDILVNNAGTRGECKNDFGKANINDFDDVLKTNVEGTFFLSELVAKYMKEKGIEGNILNIASSSSLRPANSAYALSKWSIRGLTLGMAKTLLPYGIVVNAIAPGPTATPMLGKEEGDNIHFPHNPSGRMTMPQEIANMAVIMTSDIGRSMVGSIVYMTGGAGTITCDDVLYEF